MQLHELYPAGLENTDLSLKRHPRFWAWRNFFSALRQVPQTLRQIPHSPLRRRALKAAETWMVERMGEGSQGLSAIFPAMLNAMMALRALGYPDTHPSCRKPTATSPGSSWMTQGIFGSNPASLPSGTAQSPPSPSPNPACAKNHPALEKSAAWLEKKEVRFKGDWAVHVPGWNPVAGPSSTKTNTTRTPTIP